MKLKTTGSLQGDNQTKRELASNEDKPPKLEMFDKQTKKTETSPSAEQQSEEHTSIKKFHWRETNSIPKNP